MIVLAIILIALIIISYFVAGLEATFGAVALADYSEEENPNLNKAHFYLSWATSITWISIGLLIIAFVVAIIAGAVGAVVLLPEVSAETVGKELSSTVESFNKAQKSSHNGFLGVQSINESHGFTGTIFKLVLFGLLVLVFGVGLLSLLAVIQILQSDEKVGLDNAILATVFAIVPFVLFIGLEGINYFYVANEKKIAKADSDKILQFKEHIIELEAEAAG
jgi:hypothetical protein